MIVNSHPAHYEISTCPADPHTVRGIIALGKSCADHDGDPPFSDQTLVQLRTAPKTVEITATVLKPHREIIGAAVVTHDTENPGSHAVLEAALAPDHRRQGLGRAMITSAMSSLKNIELLDAWAHGNHTAATVIAREHRFEPVRELHRLLRPLTQVTHELPVQLPRGVSLRHFVVGQDEHPWLQLNSAAFVDHPEQGKMTYADLRQRQTENWFDPQGFLLAHRTEDPMDIVGFHWTKIHPATDQGPARGEVHVVGISPEYQGRGLGKALTVAGLHYLAQRGLQEALLYVDRHNTAAFTLYRSLGFSPWHLDVMYTRGLNT